MEIEVLKEDSQGFEVMIIGEGHTLLNLLTTFLDRHEKVEYAAYKIEHPLVGEPKLYFTLKGVKKSEDIPIRKIKGIGPKTALKFESVGITTAGQFVISDPVKLSDRTGIAQSLLSRYLEEARKTVPPDKFGYRAVLKEALADLKKSLEEIKKGV